MRVYEQDIDKAIIKSVYDEALITRQKERKCKCQKGEISSGELKQSVEEHCRNGKEIPKALFSSRLRQMLEREHRNSRYLVNPVLKKTDYGRGSNICYSLTDNARIRLNLKIPILKEESAREKAYQLFLNFMAFQNVPTNNNKSVTFSSEEEFERFLFKIHMPRNELKQVSVKNEIIHRQIRMSKNGLKMVKEPIRVTTFSKEQHHSDIAIYRIDYLKGSEKEGSFYYTYRLPGISINEILNYDQTALFFSHIKLTKDEVIEYFQLLEEEGLVKRIRSFTVQFLDEIRYDIANEALRKLLIECSLLHGISVSRMYLTWKNFRPPTKEEEEWFTIFFGDARTKNTLEALRQYCRERNQQLKQCHPEQRKNRNQEVKKAIQDFESGMQRTLDKIKDDYAHVIADYSFLADVLLEWVYPNFLRELQKNNKI